MAANVFSNMRFALLLPLVVALFGCQTAPESSVPLSADVIIENGQVFDGTGAAGKQVDIAISGDEIAYVGAGARYRYAAETTIDARGKIVAPGFIDPHTHAGSDLASTDSKRRANLPFAFQGVTTVAIGNDGRGKTNIAAQAASASKNGVGTNIVYLAGFGHMRETVLGKENRAPSDAELGRMKAMMKSAMCEGASGLSAGLYYTPQNFAKTGEVVALAKIAGAHGGIYDTHMRDESTYNIGVSGAVSEALEIGKQSGTPVHISHIKALGPEVWGHSSKMIALIEAAQAAGQVVTADQYPWAASGTRISNALVPRWALDGGLDGLRERLKDAKTLARIKADMAKNLKRRGGADKLLITAKLGDAAVVAGKTLAETASAAKLDAIDMAVEILRKGDARVASFNMNASDIRAFAAQDWVVTGSDGSTGHPRKYASFPKAYQDFVMKEKLMTLAQFIRRSSGKTADIFGLKDRGYLKAGMKADIVIFDPAKFAPVATYQKPKLLSVGVEHLFVNGAHAIKDQKYTGALSGMALLKKQSCKIAVTLQPREQ